MTRKIASAIGLVLLGALIAPLVGAAGDTIQDVAVTNFPSVQRISGEVSLTGRIQMAEQVDFDDALVAPVSPRETTRLVNAGTLESHGYGAVMLTITGLMKADVSKVGEIGAVLVPDTQFAIDAFNEKGQFITPLEVRATVGAIPTYFASPNTRYQLAFKRYRIYLYNTTDKSASVHVTAYLTNS